MLVFELEIPIRWGDMDALGHVNNTVYFRYMEQTRISWFDTMGFGSRYSTEGPIIVSAHCTFERQFEYPGTVLCRHYVGRIGNSSFETFDEMSRADDPGRICAHGGARVVWVDYGKQKSRPLPEHARQAILVPRLG